VLAAFIAAAVSLVGPPPARAKEAAAPLTQIKALLQARTDAQRSKNRLAYAATIDPSATQAFRDAQMAGFDGLAALPVDRITYAVEKDSTDLTRGVDRAKYGGAPVELVTTVRSLRFTYDARATYDPMFWTFVRRGSKWYVGGDDDIADLGLETSVGMWDIGPVTSVTSEHFMFITHPPDAPRAQALLDLTERSLGEVTQRFPLAWLPKLVALLPSSPEELGRLLQSTYDVNKYVAFVSYGYNPDTLKPTAPRLYVQDRNLARYPASFQVETLTHELTHAASSSYAGPFVPSWVHEGIADWLAAGTGVPFPRASGAGTHAPRDADFASGSQGDIVRAYRDARSLVATMAALKGTQEPFDFFKTLGSYRVAAGNTPYLVDKALREVGIDGIAALEAAWAGS
jgi:hypothetical protein